MASTYVGGTDVANVTGARPQDRELSLGGKKSAPRVWTLSPSDLTFLYGTCRRCFYLKHARKSPRPQAPFPTIFRTIDGAIKRRFCGTRSEDLIAGAPPGEITHVDRWVRSAPWHPTGSASVCVLRGRIDAAIAADGGGLVVIDFKTTEPKPDHAAFYARQLEAYAHALEHPATGVTASVTGAGLVVFSPKSFEVSGRTASLNGVLRWQDVPRDPLGFETYMGQALALLDAPETPPPAPGCQWCAASFPSTSVA
jgi:hypothetical protein